ncbi:CbtA family protein [Mycobacterium sp. CBMA271]|uniref:CbtA family protein n=1 Tax=unclassified Mycobacteroides TaxID=2618759 RepID=UPI0012DFD58B|nr:MULTISPECIES: CbtA family protein [unclassified Mycobacteroides]MUM16888.1 cobalt transporter [Mycobacteroides sp. CBMA 326]MUM24123.1 CbtA family protein [Mycobacteroides sp. CBMA 271]
MEKSIILRGLGFGAVGGLLSFIFGWIFVEPVINRAISYEEGRGEAQAAIDAAAGVHAHHEGAELFSRFAQANAGLALGVIGFGVAMGALFAVAYVVAIGRVGNLSPRGQALSVAGGLFLVLYVVPFLKFPANPPAASAEGTIKERTGYFVLMIVVAAIALTVALWVGRALAERWETWTATLVAAAVFVVLVGLVMAVTPGFVEAPQPLLDANGTIVYPGFPAHDLYLFRLYSFLTQAIMWATIGIGFATVVGRKTLNSQAATTG